MKARLNLKYLEIDMSTRHLQTDIKEASRPTGLDGIVALLGGYEAS